MGACVRGQEGLSVTAWGLSGALLPREGGGCRALGSRWRGGLHPSKSWKVPSTLPPHPRSAEGETEAEAGSEWPEAQPGGAPARTSASQVKTSSKEAPRVFVE